MRAVYGSFNVSAICDFGIAWKSPAGLLRLYAACQNGNAVYSSFGRARLRSIPPPEWLLSETSPAAFSPVGERLRASASHQLGRVANMPM